jgi:hypothetical protein
MHHLGEKGGWIAATRNTKELHGSKHLPDLICSLFNHEHNSDFILLFPVVFL